MENIYSCKKSKVKTVPLLTSPNSNPELALQVEENLLLFLGILPIELRYTIFSFLDPVSIIKLTETSKKLKEDVKAMKISITKNIYDAEFSRTSYLRGIINAEKFCLKRQIQSCYGGLDSTKNPQSVMFSMNRIKESSYDILYIGHLFNMTLKTSSGDTINITHKILFERKKYGPLYWPIDKYNYECKIITISNQHLNDDSIKTHITQLFFQFRLKFISKSYIIDDPIHEIKFDLSSCPKFNKIKTDNASLTGPIDFIFPKGEHSIEILITLKEKGKLYSDTCKLIPTSVTRTRRIP